MDRCRRMRSNKCLHTYKLKQVLLCQFICFCACVWVKTDIIYNIFSMFQSKISKSNQRWQEYDFQSSKNIAQHTTQWRNVRRNCVFCEQWAWSIVWIHSLKEENEERNFAVWRSDKGVWHAVRFPVSQKQYTHTHMFAISTPHPPTSLFAYVVWLHGIHLVFIPKPTNQPLTLSYTFT